MTIAIWAGVAVIGGLGAVLRFLADRAVARRSAHSFPMGTLTVNLSGAAVLGLISGMALGPAAGLLIGTALIGCYTTFSTWMLETHRLTEERERWPAAANIVVSVVLGLGAVALGRWVGGLL
ncbi:MAG TPA: fluoride efflux transporter CrcB [Mycobacterium sp.]|nr:fluoride efflux transporter CrcB [Mycobacterium sp.]